MSLKPDLFRTQRCRFEGKSDDKDVELQSAELEMLVRARALGALTGSNEECYRLLCARERELLRDDKSHHDEDAQFAASAPLLCAWALRDDVSSHLLL